MSKKAIIITIGILAFGGFIFVNFAMKKDKSTDVKSAVAKVRSLVEEVSASGRIQPRTKVDITSEINGEVIGLFVNEGDNVQRGDLLVVLDTVLLRSDVDQGLYAMTEVKARMEGAKANLDK